MPDVLLEVMDDGVALVTLNRPKQRNAMSANLTKELRYAITECEAREDVKAIVLTGSGKAFCAGVDLKEFASGSKGGTDPRANRGSPGEVDLSNITSRVHGCCLAAHRPNRRFSRNAFQTEEFEHAGTDATQVESDAVRLFDPCDVNDNKYVESL